MEGTVSTMDPANPDHDNMTADSPDLSAATTDAAESGDSGRPARKKNRAAKPRRTGPKSSPTTETQDATVTDMADDNASTPPTGESGFADDPQDTESVSEANPPIDGDASNTEAVQPSGSETQSSQSPAELLPHRIVEAILMSADTQLPAPKIAAILGIGTAKDVRKHIETLNAEYAERGSAYRIEEIAGGYQILTQPEYNPWLTKLLRVRQETKLTTAAMETLAVVAYKQPCTRADVEAVRGVAAGDMLNKLREMNLVKIVGRAEELGRPILYGTTRRFLEAFGLPSLEDLPQVEALKLAPAKEPAPQSKPANDESESEAAPIPFPETIEDDSAAAADSVEDQSNSDA